MKRILTLLFFVMICLMAQAEWIKASESTRDTFYINDNIEKDENGYYIVWYKEVTNKSALSKRRSDLYKTFKNKKYLKYTHQMIKCKFDLNKNRYYFIYVAEYASKEPINTRNIEYCDWQYPIPDSTGEEILNKVKKLVEEQESSN